MENTDTLFMEGLLVSIAHTIRHSDTANNNIHAELKCVYFESINSIISLYLQCLNLAGPRTSWTHNIPTSTHHFLIPNIIVSFD